MIERLIGRHRPSRHDVERQEAAHHSASHGQYSRSERDGKRQAVSRYGRGRVMSTERGGCDGRPSLQAW
jgi:hypothetical protein